MPDMLQKDLSSTVKILMVDDDEGEYRFISELLKERPQFKLDWQDTLQKGMDKLAHTKPDLILLDLYMTDSKGLDTFKRMKATAQDTPIIILSGLTDENAALEAIQMGAQDFLVKDHTIAERLPRVVQFAIKRHQRATDPKNADLMDPVTGLANRHGFLKAAEPFLKSALRNEQEFFVCCAVLKNLEKIKSSSSEGEAERAIQMVSDIFRESFRSSDIIGRFDADKFVVLATVQPDHDAKSVSGLIQKNQKFYNMQFNHYALSLSIATHQFAKRENVTVEGLSNKIDALFQSYKVAKKPVF
jgi:diguanylate cyclase (GGDEF)-like protein